MENNQEKIYRWTFFLLGSICLLWQMLLPGHVILLDMAFTPTFHWPSMGDGLINGWPLHALFYVLNQVFPGWMIEKLILFSVFFLLFYIPFNYLHFRGRARYFVALFYALNPFVYERFLAGHWAHLAAYALLPLLIFAARAYLSSRSKKELWRLALVLTMIGILSPHFFLIAAIVYALVFVFFAARSRAGEKLRLLARYSLPFLATLLFSSYWIIAALYGRETNILGHIDASHLAAFSAASDARYGLWPNLMSLYGFWGEREAWATSFIWPKDSAWLFWGALAAVITLSLCGLRYAWQQKERDEVRFFAFLFAASLILASGLSSPLFLSLNDFLYTHIPLWSGFRDSSKWLALTALAYAYFVGQGFVWLQAIIMDTRVKKILIILLFALPLVINYPMLGGFARQQRSVEYPASWREAEEIVSADIGDGQALFLPWHAYLSFAFNDNHLSANLAKRYFSFPIQQSKDMEIGAAKETGLGTDARLERMVKAKKADLTKEYVNSVIVENRIRYVIFAKDLAANDIYDYTFLDYLDKKEIFDRPDLTLYEIMLR